VEVSCEVFEISYNLYLLNFSKASVFYKLTYNDNLGKIEEIPPSI